MLLLSPRKDTAIISPETIAIIDFEFQVPFYEILITNYSELQNTISKIMTEALKKSDINLTTAVSVNLEKPQTRESTNLQIKGYFTCLEIHREIYVRKWKELVHRRMLSREFIAFIQKQNGLPLQQRTRMAIMHMNVKWSNDDICDAHEYNAKEGFEDYRKFTRKYNDDEKDVSSLDVVKVDKSSSGNGRVSLDTNIVQMEAVVEGGSGSGIQKQAIDGSLVLSGDEEEQLRLTF